MIRAAAAVAALVLLVPPARADESEAFYHGTNLVRQERYEEAVRVFADLVARAPDDDFADEALHEMARVYEEKLNRPEDALAAYERLLADHPGSRLFLRARTRAEILRKGLGPGGRDAEALAAFNDILYQYSSRSPADSMARMGKLLEEHPRFALAPRAAHWVGEQHARLGEYDEALAYFDRVITEWPDSEWAPRAVKDRGDVLRLLGNLDGAEAAYRSLLLRDDEDLARIAEESLRRLEEARWLRRFTWLAWALLALFVLASAVELVRLTGSWREASRALWPPPFEVVYLIPVALVFVLAGLSENVLLGHAIEIVCAGGLAVTWLGGAVLESARTHRGRVALPRALLFGAGGALCVLALGYIAVTQEGLLDFLAETFRHGPER